MSNLIEHAKRELSLAGLDKPDSDYNGMIATAVLELVAVFAAQGHSGFSARMTRDVFDRLASFKPLTPVTDNPSEWVDVSAMSGPDGPCWQNVRHSSCFSNDGGKTYYDIDADDDRAVKTSAVRP